MKPLLYTAIVLSGCVFLSLQPSGVYSCVQGQQIRRMNEFPAESEEEKHRRISECELADQVKPSGEIKRVSQLCGKAIELPRPPYPEEAKSKGISGIVAVDVVTNEHGRVIWARAISGPEPLRRASESAACRARYSPTVVAGRSIKTETTIKYSFVR